MYSGKLIGIKLKGNKLAINNAPNLLIIPTIKNPEKLRFIKDEYSILKDQLEKKIKSSGELNELYKSLKEINSKLWVIEDEKRLCEKEKEFDEKFIKLSREVHFLNDDRAKIKLEINNLTNSKIKEIKEYTNY